MINNKISIGFNPEGMNASQLPARPHGLCSRPRDPARASPTLPAIDPVSAVPRSTAPPSVQRSALCSQLSAVEIPVSPLAIPRGCHELCQATSPVPRGALYIESAHLHRQSLGLRSRVRSGDLVPVLVTICCVSSFSPTTKLLYLNRTIATRALPLHSRCDCRPHCRPHARSRCGCRSRRHPLTLRLPLSLPPTRRPLTLQPTLS